MITLREIPKQYVYDAQGNPLAGGPTCATCGALAAFDEHPKCERRRGSLIVAFRIGAPTRRALGAELEPYVWTTAGLMPLRHAERYARDT